MDLSALGIKVTSDGVTKTTSELTSFSKAAKDAGKTASKPIKVNAGGPAIAKAAADVQKLDASLAGAGVSTARLTAQTQAEIYARRAAATAAERAANVEWNAAKAKDSLANASRRASVALREQAASATQASAAVGRSTGAMRANTANIAAQFQDVGVTAAMGMNPLIIGLQQGTQLSAVFAQSGATMGQTLAAAFKQVASAQALMTIGIVAGAAALLQMVDWSKLAQSALIGMADILVDIAPYAVAAAGALSLIYAPAIIGGIIALTKAFASLAVAMLAALPVPVLIVAGLTAIVAAAIHFRDALTQVLGFDIVQAAQDGVNYIIGVFVGGYNGIKAAWGMLPAALGDIAIRAANAVLNAISGMIRQGVALMNPLLMLAKNFGFDAGNLIPDFGQLSNPYAGAEAAFNGVVTGAINAAVNVDYLGKAIKGVRGIAGSASKWLRDLAKSMGVDVGADGGSVANSAKDAAKEMDAWAKIMEDIAKQARGLEQAGQRIGVYGMALARMTYEQELLNKALDAGIEPTAKQREELAKLGGELAKLSEDNRYRQFIEDFRKSSTEQIAALAHERVELGLTGEELYEYQFVQEAISNALRNNIILKGEDIALIRDQGRAYAQSKADIDAQNEAMRAAQDEQRFRLRTIQGAFFDFFDAIREGGNVFKAFADSVINSLNRVIDKLLDQALQGLFSGGGGGFLGGLFGGNSLVSSAASTIASNPAIFAKGGAFGQGGVQKFAKGGAFTNSVVSSPTLFRFAKGGALGEMGEAGAEAIMPLKRGPDGSLGVMSHGNDNSLRVSVSVDTSGNLTAFVRDQAGAVVAQSAPVIADAGSRQAQARIANKNTRRVA